MKQIFSVNYTDAQPLEKKFVKLSFMGGHTQRSKAIPASSIVLGNNKNFRACNFKKLILELI